MKVTNNQYQMFTRTQMKGQHKMAKYLPGSPKEFKGLQAQNPAGICHHNSAGMSHYFATWQRFGGFFFFFLSSSHFQQGAESVFSGIHTHLSFWLPLPWASYSNMFSLLSGCFPTVAQLLWPAWAAHRPSVVSYRRSPRMHANRCSFSVRDASKDPIN